MKKKLFSLCTPLHKALLDWEMTGQLTMLDPFNFWYEVAIDRKEIIVHERLQSSIIAKIIDKGSAVQIVLDPKLEYEIKIAHDVIRQYESKSGNQIINIRKGGDVGGIRPFLYLRDHPSC